MNNINPKLIPNFLVLDLEMNQPSGDITQIGAVAGDPVTGKIHESFNQYIRLNGEVMAERIIKLTKITDKLLHTKGVSLEEGVQNLKKFMARNNVNSCPASWGRDGAYLQDRVNNYGIDIELFGYDDEFNIKKLYQSYKIKQGKSMQGGVSSACKDLGFPFVGRKHNALDDAFNTFVIWRELLNKISKD